MINGFGNNSYHQTGNVKHAQDQTVPYLNSREHIGIDENTPIVKVVCDDETSLVICEA